MAADPDFRLVASNQAAAADICQQLDGIPLAIELAAARVLLLGVEGLRLRLGERLRLLTGGAPDRPLRHRTLAAALDWSHALLSPVQQTVFRRLGAFRGSFDLEAAQAVAADTELDAWAVLDALGVLVDQSMLTIESATESATAPSTESAIESTAQNLPRYRLLETMRHCALAHLSRSPEEAAIRARHRDFCVALAMRSRTPLVGPEQGRWLARLDADRNNLYAAHRACDAAPARHRPAAGELADAVLAQSRSARTRPSHGA